MRTTTRRTTTPEHVARQMGQEAGSARASLIELDADEAWEAALNAFDGNLLADFEYSPLSGEWAGESIPEIFGEWPTESVLDAYEEGAVEAFYSTLEEIVWASLSDDQQRAYEALLEARSK